MEFKGFDTLALHAGHTPDKETHSRAVPIYQTTSFTFEDTEHAADLFALKKPGNIYTRIMNPTTDVLEKRITALEGGLAGLATSSGQAATTLIALTICKAGDEIVASTSLYGGTHTLMHYTFEKMGIKTIFVDPTNPEDFRKAITPKTKLIFGETIGNPKLNVFPIEEVAKIAHEAGLPLAIDNTSATPYLVNPIKYGADIVMHSLTKWLGGHGNSIGGMIIDSGKFDWSNGKFNDFVDPDPSYHGLKFVESFGEAAFIAKARVQILRDVGACLSPFNAFLILQGIETLSLRMQRHCENALAVAKYLEQHDKVSKVIYPTIACNPQVEHNQKYLPKGGGSLVGFCIKGGYEDGKKFINSVKLLSHLANIGDSRSLVIHPASTTHQQLSKEEREAGGVTDDYIRLSIGIEDIEDIIADFEQALEQI